MESNVNIPVLDKPVDPAEVDYVIKHQVKSNKGCGPDGLCPGIFKLLPVQWIMFLTVLFTNILYNCYPENWYFVRLHILFKKGMRNLCDNYRGISVMSTLAKIYDYVLYNRLRQWFTPDQFSTWSRLYRAYSDLEINNGYMLKKKVTFVYSICRFLQSL